MGSTNRIQELRTAAGWSKEELALRLNVHPRTIHRYEIGETAPSDTQKARLADLFGVSIGFLMGWSDNPENGS